MVHLPETKKEFKNLCRQAIQTIYKNELDKACFQHDMAYGKSKYLIKRTQSDKVLGDKAFKVVSGPKYDGYQRGLASMASKCFDKTSSGSGVATGPNYQLANELHKQIIRNFKRRKVYSSFRDNIWGVDLADMQSLSKYNKRIKYLFCAIDLFSKYAWVVPLKDKRRIFIVNAFQKKISKRQPNKIWVDQGGDFYIKLLRFLKLNNIEMYSAYNEGKSVVTERFIRTLKNKIFKHMTGVSKNVYFEVLTILLINTITQFIELLK